MWLMASSVPRWRARSAAGHPAFSRSADVIAISPYIPPILREQTSRDDGLRARQRFGRQ
jgi:hypothetical protein